MSIPVAFVVILAALLWAAWATRPLYWLPRKAGWLITTRRGPVAWRTVDFPLAAAAVIVLTIVAQRVFVPAGAPVAPPAPVDAPRHDLEVIIADAKGPGLLLLAAFAAVVVAPVFEELFFRVLVQDWIEVQSAAWCATPRFALLATAAFFALLHTRAPGPEPSLDQVVGVMSAMVAAELCAIPWLLGLLARRTRGPWRRAVWGGIWAIRRDIAVGLLALAAAAPAVYALQAALRSLVEHAPPDWRFAPDPAPLFLLAIMLGWLRLKTRRMTASLVLHSGVNLISLMLALAAS